MDDIFDNLIYIIITIVAFAISLLGKKKKKDPSGGIPVSNEEAGQQKAKPFFSNLEQIFKEELGLTSQTVQDPYAQDHVVEEEADVTVNHEGALDFVPPEMLDDKEDVPYSIEYDNKLEDISLGSIKDAEIEPEEDKPIIEGFNLRDAVIYSEIINKKEY